MSRYQYHACEHCGCPGVETAYRFCGRCEIKHRGLAETRQVLPPGCGVNLPPLGGDLTAHDWRGCREPGSDDDRPVRCIHCRGVIPSGTVCPSCVRLLAELGADEPESPPEHNGFWLYHAAVKRGVLEWFQSFGTDHGYPSNMTKWSRAMTAQAVEARKAATKGAAR